MIFINNKYTRYYFDIINLAKFRENDENEKYDIHHIIPECFYTNRTRKGPPGWLDGDPEYQDNKVFLTHREHYICHRLLVKMTEGIAKRKMVYAAWQMSRRRQSPELKISSRTYAYLRQTLSYEYIGVPKTELHKFKLRKPKINTERMGRQKGCKPWNTGLTANIDDRLRDSGRKISNSKKGKSTGENNSFYGKTHSDETRKLISKSLCGRKLSQSHVEKMSSSLKGNIPWNKGQVASESHRVNVSKSLIGDIYITDGTNNKRIKPADFYQFDPTIWRRGRSPK